MIEVEVRLCSGWPPGSAMGCSCRKHFTDTVLRIHLPFTLQLLPLGHDRNQFLMVKGADRRLYSVRLNKLPEQDTASQPSLTNAEFQL
jgi:hypothetical protein